MIIRVYLNFVANYKMYKTLTRNIVGKRKNVHNNMY